MTSDQPTRPPLRGGHQIITWEAMQSLPDWQRALWAKDVAQLALEYAAYGDTYYGNFTLGRRLEAFDKLRVVVSGHTHVGVDSTHTCPDQRHIQALVVDSDYEKPNYVVVDTNTFPIA